MCYVNDDVCGDAIYSSHDVVM